MPNLTATAKPAKPYADFPLFPHDTGRWANKIKGKLRYFGKWADWRAALELYQQQRDDLHAGRKPRTHIDGVQVRDVLNEFTKAKPRRLRTAKSSRGRSASITRPASGSKRRSAPTGS